METQEVDYLKALKEPFPADDIEWRVGRCGKSQDGKIWATCLAYIEARAAQDRLDEVVGPENWKVEYTTVGGKDGIDPGIICKLSIGRMIVKDRSIDKLWTVKEDGAEQTENESFKGGLSSAFKRAASAWGIGRYLYNMKEEFATIVDKKTPGARYGKTKEGDQFYWIPPQLPEWALPKKKILTPGVNENNEKKNTSLGSQMDQQSGQKDQSPTPIADPLEKALANPLDNEVFGVGSQYMGRTFKDVLKEDSSNGYKYAHARYADLKKAKQMPEQVIKYLDYCQSEGVL